MQKLFQSLLLGSALALTTMGAHAADRNRDVSVSVGDADVSVGLGSRNGLKADVDASLGGRNATNANVDVSTGGRKGLDASATIGANDAANADVDISLGRNTGLNAGVKAGIGDDVNVDIGLGVDNANPVTTTGVDPGTDPVTDPGGSLTSAQRQAFNAMSSSERKALLKRCNSVGSGGYDPALVQLCKLLRMSASR